MITVTMSKTGNSSTLTVPASLRGPDDRIGARYSVSSPAPGTYVYRRIGQDAEQGDIEGWLESITVPAAGTVITDAEASAEIEAMRRERGVRHEGLS